MIICYLVISYIYMYQVGIKNVNLYCLLHMYNVFQGVGGFYKILLETKKAFSFKIKKKLLVKCWRITIGKHIFCFYLAWH